MFENTNDVPNEKRQKIDEICSEIQKLLEGTKDPDALSRKGALSPRLKRLIALGSAIATQQQSVIASCVAECLRLGATREEITEVLRLAISMAEVPPETYDTIVREAIDSFESQD